MSRNLCSRIERIEDVLLPKPKHIPAVTLITSALSGCAGLAEAKAQAEREGRPLLVVELVPEKSEHE